MPNQKQILYIAYGSNLNLRQMKYRCPTAKPLGGAELQGYELLFRGHDGGAVATVEPGDDSVPVLLWELKPRDEQALDVYEGWPSFYRKETVDVDVDGQTVPAMIYIMNDGPPLGRPSRGYFNTILEGYESAGFDTGVLDRALERSQAQELEQVDDMQMDFNWWR